MGKYDEEEEFVTYDKEIPAYWLYALIGFIFNPLGGIIALLLAWESQRCVKNGWKHARRYSDLSFAFSVFSILSTILIILLVYASGAFPDDTYFNRDDIIRGYTTTMTTPVNTTTTTVTEAMAEATTEDLA